MTQLTVNHEIQKMLIDDGDLTGPIDGKIGPKTIRGIENFLKERGINSFKWSRARKIVAAEQYLYKSLKIDIGKIDGLVGPSTKHAREVYAAQRVLNWRDKEDIVEVKPVAIKNTKSTIAWPRQSEVTKFFGKPGTNQVTCTVPFPLVLAWDTKQKLTTYSCHKLVKEPMERVWNRTLDHYGYEKIKQLRLHYFGGCLNVRKMRGGSAWSMHSWGIAIDIDPDRNALKTPWKQAQMSKPEYKKFVEFWYDEGFINLGVERNYDAMHFEATRGK